MVATPPPHTFLSFSYIKITTVTININNKNIALVAVITRVYIDTRVRITKHSLERSLSYSPYFPYLEALECNTNSDWQNRMVQPIRICVTFKCFYTFEASECNTNSDWLNHTL